MGTVQAAIANGVLDAVRADDLPKDCLNEMGIIVSVRLSSVVIKAEKLDHKSLFDIHHKGMTWLLTSP